MNIFFFGDHPYAIEPEDCDHWSNPDAEIRMVEILVAITDAGYSGIKLKVHGETSDRKLYWSPQHNIETPEGRLAAGIIEMAKAGINLPTVNEALSILERVYLEHGLPLPEKTTPQIRAKGNS